MCFPCDNPSQNHFAITRALSRSFRLAFTGEQRRVRYSAAGKALQ